MWISVSLWDFVKIHWISVNIAPQKKFSSATLTEIQWIFTESQRISLIQIQSGSEISYDMALNVKKKKTYRILALFFVYPTVIFHW